MGSCAVKGCKSNSRHRERKMFRIPRNITTRKIWHRLITRNNRLNLINARVCDLHFKSEDFLESDGINSKRLKVGSLPSVNLPSYPGSSVRLTATSEAEGLKVSDQKMSENHTSSSLSSSPAGSSVCITTTSEAEGLKVSAEKTSENQTSASHSSSSASNSHSSIPGSSDCVTTTSEAEALKVSAEKMSENQTSASDSSSPAANPYLLIPEETIQFKQLENGPHFEISFTSLCPALTTKFVIPPFPVKKESRQNPLDFMRDTLLKANSKLSFLENQCKLKDMRYKNLLQQNSLLKRQISTLSSRTDVSVIDKLSNYFSKAQIKQFLTGRRIQKWSEEDIVSALAFKNVSIKGYKYAKKNLKLPLPSITTLNSYVRNKNCNVEPEP